MITGLKVELPKGKDLYGSSGTLYRFWGYKLDEELAKNAIGQDGIYYLAKVVDNNVVEKYNLTKTNDVSKIMQSIPNHIKLKDDIFLFINQELIIDMESAFLDLISFSGSGFTTLSM